MCQAYAVRSALLFETLKKCFVFFHFDFFKVRHSWRSYWYGIIDEITRGTAIAVWHSPGGLLRKGTEWPNRASSFDYSYRKCSQKHVRYSKLSYMITTKAIAWYNYVAGLDSWSNIRFVTDMITSGRNANMRYWSHPPWIPTRTHQHTLLLCNPCRHSQTRHTIALKWTSSFVTLATKTPQLGGPFNVKVDGGHPSVTRRSPGPICPSSVRPLLIALIHEVTSLPVFCNQFD